MSRKVLIITYYWPPSGGAGVQRWLKFTKYLPNFGWAPVIYTPENPEIPSHDDSLVRDIPAGTEVIKLPITEPYHLYKKFIGQKKGEKINTGFLAESDKPRKREQIARWLRGNFFIPDARKFWIKPSIRFLKKYLADNPVDVIISTGPPHSMHLIAQQIQKATGIPWIADFRDPWTRIDFYEELNLSSWAHRRHCKLEKSVLEGADQIVAIGDLAIDDFREIADIREIECITNGYDEDDFAGYEVPLDKKFSLAHIGSFSPARNPGVLWQVVRDLCNEVDGFREDFSLKLVGKIDISVRKDIEEYGLNDLIDIRPYMPHSEVVKEQMASQVLLLVVNNTRYAKSILTGKIFEYLRSNRPILLLGPTDGEAARIIAKTKAGKSSNHGDYDTLKETLLAFYNDFRSGDLHINAENVEYYSRKNLTARMAALLDKISA